MTVPPESSEERYRAFIEQTSEGVWRCEVRDPIDVRLPVDQQIDAIYAHAWLAECNDAMARMYGLDSADQIVGVTIAELMPRDDPANLEYLGAFIRSGYTFRSPTATAAGSNETPSSGRALACGTFGGRPLPGRGFALPTTLRFRARGSGRRCFDRLLRRR